MMAQHICMSQPDPKPQALYEDIYTRERQFSFGDNWRSYLEHFTPERLDEARASILNLTGREDLKGCHFLDIGCGSGLFSLSAFTLGAKVTSVDIDHSSLECARSLKEKFEAGDDEWEVLEGSALDADFLSGLGDFDLVYSWGVLHHTGDMWKGLQNARERVSKDGTLVIALYNKTDPLWISKVWKLIKCVYNAAPDWGRSMMMSGYSLAFCLLRFKGNLKAFKTYRDDYLKNRGMHYLHDVKDWLGGYPYEVASPEEIRSWSKEGGFQVVKTIEVGRTESGCNEYVIRHSDSD